MFVFVFPCFYNPFTPFIACCPTYRKSKFRSQQFEAQILPPKRNGLKNAFCDVLPHRFHQIFHPFEKLKSANTGVGRRGVSHMFSLMNLSRRLISSSPGFVFLMFHISHLFICRGDSSGFVFLVHQISYFSYFLRMNLSRRLISSSPGFVFHPPSSCLDTCEHLLLADR